MIRQMLTLAAAAAILAGCNGDPEQEADGGNGSAASGEVLEGSISDEMIPLDQLRSQPPRAAPEPGEESSGAGSAPAGQPADAAAEPEQPAEDSPQPEPEAPSEEPQT